MDHLNTSINQELEEFDEQVLNPKTRIRVPIPTHFIDSTPLAATFMNAK